MQYLWAIFCLLALVLFAPLSKWSRAGKHVEEDLPDFQPSPSQRVERERWIERVGWLETQVYTERSKLN